MASSTWHDLGIEKTAGGRDKWLPAWQRTLAADQKEMALARVTVAIQDYANVPVNQRETYPQFAEKLNEAYGTAFTGESLRKYVARNHQRACALPSQGPDSEETVSPGEIAHIEAQHSFHEDGNTAVLTALEHCPRTLEELLDACKVDRELWEVEKYVVNTWPVGARIGTAIIRTPLYQVKAWLQRRIPIAIEIPVVQPIIVKLPLSKAKKLHTPFRSTQRFVCWPDTQVGFRRNMQTGRLTPFHDRRALDLALQLTQHIQPDLWIFLGDGLDLPEWSTHYLVRPEYTQTTQPAVVEWGWWLGQAASTPGVRKKIYLKGNHEERIETAMITHLQAAYELRPRDDLQGHALLSTERMLGLASLGMELCGPYPGSEYWVNENLQVQHGTVVRSQSGATVKKLAEDLRHSTICGHIHRAEKACKTLHMYGGQRTYFAMSAGTLASIAPGVVPANSPRVNWQQAIAYGEYEPGDGLCDADLILFYDGECLFDGRKWEARPEQAIVEQIEAETQYKVR